MLFKQDLHRSICLMGNKPRGFSLAELLITLTIIAILLAMSIPSFNKTMAYREAMDVKKILLSALKLSKNQSYNYRQHVVLCLADDNKICHKDATQQLLVFFDKEDNHVFDANQDTIIMQHFWKLKHGDVYLRVGARRHYVKFFAGTGHSRGHMGHIKYCPHNLNTTNRYQISFNMIGHLKYKPDALHPTQCP